MNLQSMLDDLVRRDPRAVIAVDAHPEHPIAVGRAAFRQRVLRLRFTSVSYFAYSSITSADK